jgi:hypothetical protein
MNKSVFLSFLKMSDEDDKFFNRALGIAILTTLLMLCINTFMQPIIYCFIDKFKRIFCFCFYFEEEEDNNEIQQPLQTQQEENKPIETQPNETPPIPPT